MWRGGAWGASNGRNEEPVPSLKERNAVNAGGADQRKKRGAVWMLGVGGLRGVHRSLRVLGEGGPQCPLPGNGERSISLIHKKKGTFRARRATKKTTENVGVQMERGKKGSWETESEKKNP